MLRFVFVAFFVRFAPLLRVCNSERNLRPNVVWIMADDLGWGEVGLYPSNSSHGRIATPHLDQFGREGIIFRQAYAGYTVCAPSRTAFFTGRHSGNFLKWGLNGEALRPNQTQTTLPQLLSQAGYRTGAFGKVAPLTSPLQQGFDTFLGQVDQALCHNMYPVKIDSGMEQLNFKLSGNLGAKSRDLCMESPEAYNYTIDIFHDHGMAWLEAAASEASRRPFFLFLSYTIPHAGGWSDAPKSLESGNPVPCDLQYADEQWPDVEKDHAAVITYLDSKVGDLLARLKALNIDKDTLVFFASDNGAHSEGGHDHRFFDSTGGLRGYKRSMFEGGVRSPTMVRWPDSIPAGRVSDFAWAFWDVLPTIAEIAGASVPNGLDGISIVPELKGSFQKEHDYLYFTWIGEGGEGTGSGTRMKQEPGYTIRQDIGSQVRQVQFCAAVPVPDYRPSLSDEMHLFDLCEDPFEKTDIAAVKPSTVLQLKQLAVSKNLSCMCYQHDQSMADDVATATAVAAASCISKTGGSGGYVEACHTETKVFSNREARNFARKTTANYLLSISEDACFVSHARESLNVREWPLLANLRAGAWYAPTDSVDATCYFKSMDGHRNQWDFSIGRLNLRVAHMAADSGGVVLVDCTGNRRKTFPDSLSKTVPIWTAVLQSMVATLQVPGMGAETFPDPDAFLHLRTAKAERPDISKLLPEWVEKLRKNLPEAEAMELVAALKGRKLRPFWVCPTDDLNKLKDELEALKEEHAIVLCMSASKVAGSTTYIQGAGDDEEAWARQLGLSPARFWRHAEELLELARSTPQEVDAAIKALPASQTQDVPMQDTAKVLVEVEMAPLSFIGGTGLAVGNFASAAPPGVWDSVDAVLNCGGEEHPEMKGDPRYLHLPAADEKKHDPTKRWWQEVLLPRALSFIARSLQRGEKVLIHCSRGDNRCPAVAAAALAAFFGPGGTGSFHLAKLRLEKADLRRCLVMVQCYHPNCMVPRRIMQFLNLFFVTEDGGWSSWQSAEVLTDQGFALYISGAFFAQSLPLLRQLGVSHIVNVTKAPNAFESKFTYHQVAIEDDRSINLLQVLDAALAFIHDARTQSCNCCVLVHCREGVSRSVSVVLAYLMRFEQLSLSDAMRLLQERRSGSCRPNAGFLQQLKAFEQGLDRTQR
eukprot:s400_g21.t2